jgi:hypothetical protein
MSKTRRQSPHPFRWSKAYMPAVETRWPSAGLDRLQAPIRRFAPVRMAPVRLAWPSVAPWRSASRRSAPVSAGQVGFDQVGAAQVKSAGVSAAERVAPPRIPFRDPSFQPLDVLLVGHGSPQGLKDGLLCGSALQPRDCSVRHAVHAGDILCWSGRC